MSVIGLLEVLYYVFVRIYKNYVLIRTKGPTVSQKEVMDKIDSILLGRHNKVILLRGDLDNYNTFARSTFTPEKKM